MRQVGCKNTIVSHYNGILCHINFLPRAAMAFHKKIMWYINPITLPRVFYALKDTGNIRIYDPLNINVSMLLSNFLFLLH